LWISILDQNVKLFNSIVKDDTINSNIVMAGYKNIKWDFWNFNSKGLVLIVEKFKVPLMRQAMIGELLISKSIIEKIYKEELSKHSLTDGSMHVGEFKPDMLLSKNNFMLYDRLIKKNEKNMEILTEKYAKDLPEILEILIQKKDI
jgi:hypothetical protein